MDGDSSLHRLKNVYFCVSARENGTERFVMVRVFMVFAFSFGVITI